MDCETTGGLGKSVVLSRTFTTRAAKEDRLAIGGIAIVKDKLFVSSFKTSEIEIYDLESLTLERTLDIPYIVNAYDMKYCSTNDCLYIMDIKYMDSPNEIERMALDGEQIKAWSIDTGYGCISVTFDSNVILATYNEQSIEEFSPDGVSLRRFTLSPERGFPHSRYAIKLPNDRYLISHGEGADPTHRVCIVDHTGQVFVAFGGERGSTLAQLNVPIFLEFGSTGSVVVIDRDNSRVLLLDSENLKLIKELIPNADYGMTRPERMACDTSRGRLFVAHNDISWKESRVFVFEQCFQNARN